MGFKPLLHYLNAAFVLENFSPSKFHQWWFFGCLGLLHNLNKCYNLEMSKMCTIITTQSSSMESFHPFVNSPLACTVTTIRNRHSSINSLIFTHCNQTLGYISFLFNAFSEWGSSIKNNTVRSTLRPSEDQISANEGVLIVISIIVFFTMSITFELTCKCLYVLYFFLMCT